MAQSGFTPIRPYYSTTSGSTPTTGNMLIGEIAVNTADKVIFTKNGSGNVVSISGGATGCGSDQVFIQNGQTVTTSYTITTNFNALSTGPITINTGAVVTVPTGSRWVVL